MQMTMVVAHTATKIHLINRASCCGKQTIIKQTIIRNEKLGAFIYRLLPHTIYASGYLPCSKHWRSVMQVVVYGVEHKVESTFVSRLLKLLSTVLLISGKQFYVSIAYIPHIVEYCLVVVYLLERQRSTVTLGIETIGHCKIARLLISFALNNAWRKMIIIERKMSVPAIMIPSKHLHERLFAIG